MPDNEAAAGKWSVDRWLAVIGTVLGVLGFAVAVLTIALAKETRENFESGFHSYGHKIVLMTTVIALALGVLAAILRTSKLATAEKRVETLEGEKVILKQQVTNLTGTAQRLEEEKAVALAQVDSLSETVKEYIPYPRDTRGRWSSIEEIKYGHLPYEPFLKYENDSPAGLGVDLLEHLLSTLVADKGVIVSAHPKKQDWGSILKGLAAKDYDVIATPLFATFDRTRSVSFTAPLFFSNVGLYVRRDMQKLFTPKNDGKVTLEIAIEKIRTAAGLKIFSVDGEISQRLARKHAAPEQIEQCDGGTLLSSLVSRVAGYEGTPYALFCESFYASHQKHVKSGQVVNILEDHEILYPVCFAVRIGDYQLRNLLNIRLLELGKSGGAFNRLTAELKALAKTKGEELSDDEISKHFVAEWRVSPGKDGPNG